MQQAVHSLQFPLDNHDQAIPIAIIRNRKCIKYKTVIISNECNQFVTHDIIGNTLLSGPGSKSPYITNNDSTPKCSQARGSRVAFSYLSEVVLLDDGSTVQANRISDPSSHSKNKSKDKHKSVKANSNNNITDSNTKQTFDVHCANITSLSDHTIKYLFKECKK